MEINYLIYSLVIISAIVIGSVGNTDENRKIFIVFNISVLILEVVLRSLSVGSDTSTYYYLFHELSNMSWGAIWRQFVYRYTVGGTEDIGYVFLVKFISTFTNSWFVYTFLTDLIFFIPFGILLYRYAKDFWQLTLGFLVYITLFHIVALCGGRQLFAMGFGIMSIMYLDQKKYGKSVIMILIGSLIHQTLLLCLLPVAMCFLKPASLKLVHVIFFLLIPVVILNANSLLVFMGEVAQNEKYSRYGLSDVVGGGITFISLLELSSILFFFAFKEESLRLNRSLRVLYTTVPLFTFFGPLIYSSGGMIRISMYFHLYMVLLIPYAIDVLFPKKRQLVYMIIMVLLMYLGLSNSGRINYYFFWQQPELFNYYN